MFGLDLLDAGEHAAIEGFNDRGEVLPLATLTARFEEQAAQTPDAVAVTFESATLSYRALNERANQLAHCLIRAGIGPESLVGIALERSLDLVVAVLATVKAGGVLPLAAGVSIRAHRADARRLKSLCCHHDRRGRRHAAVAGPGPVAGLRHNAEGVGDGISIQSHGRGPWSTAAAGAPGACVIYTSGSTGTPKGVLVSHQNVTRLFEATDHWFHFGPHDAWTLFHSYAFDFSVWELWGALLFGGQLVVVPKAITRSPGEFSSFSSPIASPS